jgi:catechol 2,3-dioxygenase-like lactoylglutathione lyase family enzyme
MFAFKGLHHVAISVPSIEAAKEFYVGKLGMIIADEAHIPPSDIGNKVLTLENADCHIMMLNAGNLFLEIFEFQSPNPKKQNNRAVCDHGYTHIAFEVEDIQLAYQYLKSAGVNWHHEPIEAGEGYMMTYGRDPFGNVIEIQQLLAGLPYSFDKLSF